MAGLVRPGGSNSMIEVFRVDPIKLLVNSCSYQKYPANTFHDGMSEFTCCLVLSVALNIVSVSRRSAKE